MVELKVVQNNLDPLRARARTIASLVRPEKTAAAVELTLKGRKSKHTERSVLVGLVVGYLYQWEMGELAELYLKALSNT